MPDCSVCALPVDIKAGKHMCISGTDGHDVSFIHTRCMTEFIAQLKDTKADAPAIPVAPVVGVAICRGLGKRPFLVSYNS